VSACLENRIVEFVDHLHEHFLNPVVVRGARYMPPGVPGFSIEMKAESLEQYEFPNGEVWRNNGHP
jgi:L-fuconate dehydratase